MRTPNVLRLAAGALVLAGGLMLPDDSAAQGARPSAVIINRAALRSDTLQMLEQAFQTRIPPGRYWYDRLSGAWGMEGGPTQGFTIAGLPIGGAMPADISRGNTGVFINGRQLPMQDLAGLQTLTGPVAPGRYWLDNLGNAGYEGGPAIVNLRMLASSKGLYRQGSGVGENYGDGSGAYHNPRTGIGIITDGGGGGVVFTP